MWIFVIVIVCFSAAFVGGAAWLMRALAGDGAQDTIGRDDKCRSRNVAINLWDKLRAWLMKKPARLDYRRDRRGRFRKVRRG